jgi:hypothetical protein
MQPDLKWICTDMDSLLGRYTSSFAGRPEADVFLKKFLEAVGQGL